MRDQLLAAIRQCEPYLEKFNRQEYAKAYKSYKDTYAQVFLEAMEATEPVGDELINATAADLLNALEAGWRGERFWNRSMVKTKQKQMMIFYLSPMLLELEDPRCARLAELLRDGWAARWPRDAYEIGSYKTIKSGFHNVILGVDLDSLNRSHDDDE